MVRQQELRSEITSQDQSLSEFSHIIVSSQVKQAANASNVWECLCCMPWGVNQESIPPTHTVYNIIVVYNLLRVLIKSWLPAKNPANSIFELPTSSENILRVEMRKKNK